MSVYGPPCKWKVNDGIQANKRWKLINGKNVHAKMLLFVICYNLIFDISVDVSLHYFQVYTVLTL